MQQHIVNTEWKGDLTFDSVANDHHVVMDVMPERGGSDQGPRPKVLLLSALAGCTGMDVIPILKKMKVVPESLNIEVTADLSEEYPKHYTHMHIIYKFKGKDLPMDKLEKAVALSEEKYCAVSFMLKKAMEITYEILVKE